MVVWKYSIDVVNEFTRDMPRGARVIHVEAQNGHPEMWVQGDPAAPREPRTFYVAGTGHTIPAGCNYLGSFILYEGTFVGHLFEPGK